MMRKKSQNLILKTSNNKKEVAMKKSLGIGLMVLFMSLVLAISAFGADKLVVETGGTPVFKVTDNGTIQTSGTDENNAFQFMTMGHAGGDSHLQIATGQSDSRLSLMAGAVNDVAPRYQAIGAQDVAAAIRGWALFDYGSILYNLPNAELDIRHYKTTGADVMARFVGGNFVTFPVGKVGIGNITPSYPLQMAGGAYCTGTQWVNYSSRKGKKNIEELGTKEALVAFNKLNPVTFEYKSEMDDQRHVGFIAEDVPDLVAVKERNGISAVDIVAVLTKIVQEQQKTISDLTEKVNRLEQQMK
jgi:hypothetical protein